MYKKIAIIFIVTVLLCGCKQDKKGNEKSGLEGKVVEIQTQINMLEDNYLNTTFKKTLPALLTPATKGYSAVYTDQGIFFISLESLNQYADGYKATFLIGNPNYATFYSMKLQLQWGRARSEKEDYGNWHEALHSEEIEANTPILPGRWNKVTVVLSPAPANEVGTILVLLEPGQIYLEPDLRGDIN